jgi:hypothetical protein
VARPATGSDAAMQGKVILGESDHTVPNLTNSLPKRVTYKYLLHIHLNDSRTLCLHSNTMGWRKGLKIHAILDHIFRPPSQTGSILNMHGQLRNESRTVKLYLLAH